MKKIVAFILLIGVLLIAGCCPNSCSAQAASNVVTVDLAKLPPDVQQAIQNQKEMDAVTQKIETYGKWAGMGKEVGIAVKDGLTAVKDVTLEIADSKLGHTVIWLVVWKVAGIDFVRIAIGLIIVLIGTFFIAKSYFRLFATKRLVSKSGFFLWRTKTYESWEYDWGGDSNRAAAQVFHLIGWLITIGICAAIAFA